MCLTNKGEEGFMVHLLEGFQLGIIILLEQRKVFYDNIIKFNEIYISLSGWSPAPFVSSRGQTTSSAQQKPEDFMDEEVN